jgi:hypothetical protein
MSLKNGGVAKTPKKLIDILVKLDHTLLMIAEFVGVILGVALIGGFYNLMKDSAIDIKNGDSSFGQKAGFFYIAIMTIVLVVGFLYAWAMGAF